MDKPVRPNTVPNVLKTLVDVQEISIASEFYAQTTVRKPELADAINSTLLAGLTNFFKNYNIDFPDITKPDDEIKHGLEGILATNGQLALDAVEGVSRLYRKVVLSSYENIDPRIRAAGSLNITSGLPLEELRTTPNKQAAAPNDRTVRDRISDLITMGKDSDDYMLKLLEDIIPKEIAKVKVYGASAQLEFLKEVFTYLYEVSNSTNFNGEPYSLGTVQDYVESVAITVVSSEEKKLKHGNNGLNPEEIAELMKQPNPKDALGKRVGGAIVALDVSTARGDKTKLGIYYFKGGEPAKATVSYGSTRTSPGTVDALLKIREACQRELAPSNPLYELNSRAKNLLPVLSER